MPKPQKDFLRKLPPHKFHQLLGEVTALLMASKVHRKFEIRDIGDILLPPINLNQFRIYRDANKRPVALVVWGKFSPAVEKKYLAGKALSQAEWNSGDIVFVTDLIAPYGHVKKVFKDLDENVFHDIDQVRTLRFTDQGVRRPKVLKFSHRKKKN